MNEKMDVRTTPHFRRGILTIVYLSHSEIAYYGIGIILTKPLEKESQLPADFLGGQLEFLARGRLIEIPISGWRGGRRP